MYLRDKETQEYLCSFCNIVYYPNNELVHKENTFDLPGPNTDSQGNVVRENIIPIAMIEDPDKNCLINDI